MRFRYLVQLGLLSAAVALGAGCIEDEDPPIKFDHHNIPQDFGPQTLPPPILDLGSIPQTTCQSEVGIIGTTQPGFNVYAVGGAGSGIKAADSSGRFCLPVSLNADQVNAISVYATDPNSGQQSTAATVTVTHQSSPECQTVILDGGITPDPENVALKATASSKEPPVTGTTNAVIDGNPSTTAHWDSNNWVPWNSYDGWVSLKLEKPTSISKIVVKWRDDYNAAEKHFGADYKVMMSATPEAGDPQEGGVWTTLETVASGDGGDDVFEYKNTQPIALHVAIWMEYDGASGSWDEQFVLAEVEVYDTPASNPQPPPPPGVCAGAF